MKFGSVALIGKSNVGKSTFINQALKIKLSITSSKVQTTRNMITGLYNDSDSQIIIYDTPGIYKTLNLMNREMMKETKRSLKNADLVLYFINSYDRFNPTDAGIIKTIKDADAKAILVVNKSDLIENEEEFFLRIQEFKAQYNFIEAVAISALNNDRINDLIEDIKSNLDEGSRIYEEDMFTDRPLNFIVSEYIREKVITLTNEEIPHSITCFIEKYEEGETLDKISASIICEKESQKPIIIGKGGKMIKEIGTLARMDIENLVSKKVFLELFVKVKENWRDNENLLRNYGLLRAKEDE